MNNKPLRSVLLEQISDLKTQKSALMGTRKSRTKTADLIGQSSLDYQIKVTELQSVVAQSPSATPLLERFIHDGGHIEFIDPQNGYLIRGRLYNDGESTTPVIALSPDDRNNFDMACAVAECLKAYDEYVLEEDGIDVFESYDSDTEELFKYEDKKKFQETAHPIYQQAKKFGDKVAEEIKTYEQLRAIVTDYKCEKNNITANPAPEFIELGTTITFNPN